MIETVGTAELRQCWSLPQSSQNNNHNMAIPLRLLDCYWNTKCVSLEALCIFIFIFIFSSFIFYILLYFIFFKAHAKCLTTVTT